MGSGRVQRKPVVSAKRDVEFAVALAAKFSLQCLC
jgi:hypothetical protein